MNKKLKNATILASSFLLSQELPSNFDELSQTKLNEFVEENSWEPLDLDIEGILDQIHALAYTFVRIQNKEIQF